MSTRNDNGLSQCIAQFHSIVEMVSALRKAEHDNRVDSDDAREAILNDALSVDVRADWYSPGSPKEDRSPSEYRILLCTGGPAVQIEGKLNGYGEPVTAGLQYQDWFTPWTEWLPANEHNVQRVLLEYARCFYFAD